MVSNWGVPCPTGGLVQLGHALSEWGLVRLGRCLSALDSVRSEQDFQIVFFDDVFRHERNQMIQSLNGGWILTLSEVIILV